MSRTNFRENKLFTEEERCMEFQKISPRNITNLQMKDFSELVADGFSRENDAENYADSVAHVSGADQLYVASEQGKLIGFAAFNRVGKAKSAAELLGIIVASSFRGQKIGEELTKNFVNNEQPTDLIAYTRNPRTASIMNEVAGLEGGDIFNYPILDGDKDLIDENSRKRILTFDDGITYDIGRYGNGLYGGNDPAFDIYRPAGQVFAERAQLLGESAGNAVVIVSKIKDRTIYGK